MGREREGTKSRQFRRNRVAFAFDTRRESLLAVKLLTKGMRRDLASSREHGVPQAAELKVMHEGTPTAIGRAVCRYRKDSGISDVQSGLELSTLRLVGFQKWSRGRILFRSPEMAVISLDLWSTATWPNRR
jgi:hypothetical protein